MAFNTTFLLTGVAQRATMKDMIKSCGNKNTEKIWARASVKGVPLKLQTQAYRKLQTINAAAVVNDLRIPPGNKLKPLQGKKWGGWHQVRVNNKYRIRFKWKNGHAYDVRFGDFHDKQ